MSLKIRLARGGSKHRPYYNVVIADFVKVEVVKWAKVAKDSNIKID